MKRKAGENQKKFMDRCMEDPAMTKEYRDAKKRQSACQAVWNKEESVNIKTESVELAIESVSLSDSDLAKINRLTMESLTKEQVYVFAAKLIDDNITGNNRKWTPEFMGNAVDKGLFVGAPIFMNHEPWRGYALGKIYHAEMSGNAINGKIFIPLNSKLGKATAQGIKDGQLKAMSIHAAVSNARTETVNGTEIEIIQAGDGDSITEVSFVVPSGVAGCQTCGVLSEMLEESETPCHCKKQESMPESESPPDELKDFAIRQLGILRAEYVRLAGLQLGASDRRTYQTVAESVSPNVLEKLIDDLKKAQPKAETLPAADNAEQFKNQIENLRNVMGV